MTTTADLGVIARQIVADVIRDLGAKAQAGTLTPADRKVAELILSRVRVKRAPAAAPKEAE